jgi:hypothetical protein
MAPFNYEIPSIPDCWRSFHSSILMQELRVLEQLPVMESGTTLDSPSCNYFSHTRTHTKDEDLKTARFDLPCHSPFRIFPKKLLAPTVRCLFTPSNEPSKRDSSQRPFNEKN